MARRHHCCWGDHSCPNDAIAAVGMERKGRETFAMYVCEEHLRVVKMKAAVRDIDVIEVRPNKAKGGQ